jgi:hypothetical protein
MFHRTELIGFFLLIAAASSLAPAADPIPLGAAPELFVDDRLIERTTSAELRLHEPAPREVVRVHDAPWEGNVSSYHTVFRDDDRYRMYYRGAHVDEKTGAAAHADLTYYLESADGVHWSQPELGLYEFNGDSRNNIVYMGPGGHNFAPFRDRNPAAPADARYKAVASEGETLIAFKSADGLHWSRMFDRPIITEGAFDSLNVAFWDPVRGEYRAYTRDFRDEVRDVKTAVSKDFAQWSDPDWLDYGDAPAEHLYTNAIAPYPRAPELLVGLPMRYVPGRNPEHHAYDGVSDCLLMTSRDGRTFHRWRQAFVRPGLQPDRWVNRNNLAAWGIVETHSDQPGAPDELSLYLTEGYYRGPAARLRRYTLRLDGFASLHAGAGGGEMTTRPLALTPAGDADALILNAATSAAGSIRCEFQDADGKPLPGFALEQCEEIYGDSVARAVKWAEGASLASLAGRPVRLRLVLRDADVYSIRLGDK